MGINVVACVLSGLSLIVLESSSSNPKIKVIDSETIKLTIQPINAYVKLFELLMI
ncbi:hypothetical protein D3C74_409330 [compost metagenome]